MSLLYSLQRFLKRNVPRFAQYMYPDNSKFYESNRHEVLTLYRYFLKEPQKLYARRLQKVSKYEEARYIFRSCQAITDINEIKVKVQFGQMIRNKLQSGEWKQLPQYSMSFGRQHDENDIVRERDNSA